MEYGRKRNYLKGKGDKLVDILFIIIILVLMIVTNFMVKSNKMSIKNFWRVAIITFSLVIIGMILLDVVYYNNFHEFPSCIGWQNVCNFISLHPADSIIHNWFDF